VSRLLLREVVIATYYKLSNDRQLLSTETQSFLSYIKRYTINFDNHTTRSYRGYEAFGTTLTFTHTYVSGFLGDRLIREDTYPHLTLTLHITGYSNTGSLNLTSGNPFGSH